MRDIRTLIEEGGITPIEAAGRMVVLTAMQKKLREQERVLRGYLADRLDAREHLTTAFGEVSGKAGAQPRWRVRDPQAFARWLAEHGEEESVEETLMPVEFATKPDAIEQLVHQYGGEAPAGVELEGGRADSVAVTKAMGWDEIFRDDRAVGQAAGMLGIEAGDDAGGTGADAWDAI